MNREWKPGDVAMVTSTVTGPTLRIYGEYPPGENGRWSEGHGIFVRAENVTAVRPLVVLDPESRLDIERLRDLYDVEVISQNGDPDPRDVTPAQRGNALQAALRVLANPTPRKPEEPQGLGAVVEDTEGRRWVRVGDYGADDWRQAGLGGGARGRWYRYDDIDPVRVLSEGVQP